MDILSRPGRPTLILAIALTLAAIAYISWKVTESPDQALQFTINGLNVGAVYALLALGFTLVYSTVWFFDLYYGAAAAIGAYAVFYLRAGQATDTAYDPANIGLNIALGLVVAGVVAWALHTAFFERLRERYAALLVRAAYLLVAVVAGGYTMILLQYPDNLHQTAAPLIALISAAVIGTVLYWTLSRFAPGSATPSQWVAILSVAAGLVVGAVAAIALAQAPESRLYISWLVSCLLAGVVSLALYRGLYAFILIRARSTLIMLVATLGVLLTITAILVMTFSNTTHPLPASFGNNLLTLGGATFKAFALFAIGCAIVGFILLWLLIHKSPLGKIIRAIGDDEQVARIVGINTTAIVAIVFFIGAMYAAFAGILTGQDIAIQPRMGLELLLKGWIASVVGGIGNLYGAILGGFLLGVVEQFGIWDIPGEWQDGVALVLLILFLSFWPRGIIPRR
ncbi:MAG: branched-chain amino acid ABC transporter permease [Dehalococcoidia bacterium]|nr:branched-chain amino acid ABC transporter permease [Dehalococcoidia bacterium]